MGILSLKPSSFIINLGITLVLSGLIMVYVKQKFASYDKQFNTIDNYLKNLVSMVQKQSASFASASSSRVNWCSQSDSKNDSEHTKSSLAAEGALDAAKDAHDRFGDKIVVSDNESDSETESETEDDSESESETDAETDIENKTEKNIEEIHLDNLKFNGEIKQIFITGEEPMHFLNNLMVLGNPKIIGKTLDLDMELDNLKDNETDDDTSDSSDTENDDSESEDDSLLANNQLEIKNDESYVKDSESLSQTNTEVLNLSNVFNVLKTQNENQSKLEENESLSLSLSHLNMSVGQLVEMSKNNLQELCKSRNLSIKGSKKELIDRLLNK